MEYNSLKSIGKIRDFDGEAGTIITPDSEFMFNQKNVKGTEAIKAGDPVSFYPSTVKFGNETYQVAREIESLQKEKAIRSKK